jgi:three-Cys-motif partner protein
MNVEFDQIGYWSEVKLDIIAEYAAAYSKILSAQRNPSFDHLYIDAFAGAGVDVSRSTGEYVAGSALNALLIYPPFKEYNLIDLDRDKADSLRAIAKANPTVRVYEGDCNRVLLQDVFPHARYEDYRRALCLLDPYGLHLNWDVIATAGHMRSVEIFLNFPVADMNRNVLWRNPDAVDPAQAERMTAFWGDDSWRTIAYDTRGNLFGFPVKQPNIIIAEAFRERMQKVAGFAYVPEPIPMRNSKNAVVYYLFFASQNPVAKKIVGQIFNKYRDRGAA